MYKKRPLLASKSSCSFCQSCINSCSHSALGFDIDRDGYYQITFDENKCVECGLCTKRCPVVTPVKRPEINPKAYAAWSTDKQLRDKSASGGAFAAIAKHVIENGGVAFGASISGFKIIHTCAEDMTSLQALQGSKYQQSELGNVFVDIKRRLKKGQLVLFSGLSCHIAGLQSFLDGKKYPNLITIDTICGGVSTLLPMLNLEASGKYSSICSFRDKSQGWKPKGYKYNLKMTGIDGENISLGYLNDVIFTFNSTFLKRSSCLKCTYNGIDRLADITICDFWGIKSFQDEFENGISGIIINNPGVEEFVKSCDLQLHPVELKEIVKNNPCYYWNKHSFYLFDQRRKKALKIIRKSQKLNNINLRKLRKGLLIRVFERINAVKKNLEYHKLKKMVK